MFDHVCSSCHQRRLIDLSQVTSVENTEQGIVVGYTCWCGSEETVLSGRRTRAVAAA